MKNLVRMAFSAVILLGIATFLIPAPTSLAASPDGGKTVTVFCKPGWRGTAVGVYGGVGFEASCNNGRGQQRLTGTVGTTYSIRMGVESSTVGVDCFFSGDAAQVNEACAEVRLSIR